MCKKINIKIKSAKEKLEKMINEKNLTDDEVIALSEKLDKYITEFYSLGSGKNEKKSIIY